MLHSFSFAYFITWCSFSIINIFFIHILVVIQYVCINTICFSLVLFAFCVLWSSVIRIFPPMISNACFHLPHSCNLATPWNQSATSLSAALFMSRSKRHVKLTSSDEFKALTQAMPWGLEFLSLPFSSSTPCVCIFYTTCLNPASCTLWLKRCVWRCTSSFIYSYFDYLQHWKLQTGCAVR